ncbi:hypothetical protein [Flexibacterium corallicola]|uniref:hypothetical protein n=1 Tax=Flexibacterium corallicola TaxID=3037259 RepID=UPI00286F86BE|nr:hypothetical protein [Pseudovibrio sp. M1P-2-3]
MDAAIRHELAAEHLPVFISAPQQGDWLFTTSIIFLIVILLLLGVFYFSLHSLPERMAHKHGERQMQLVAVMALTALFTHNNYLWIAALLLAAIRLPDFETPLRVIARTLSKLTRNGGEK